MSRDIKFKDTVNQIKNISQEQKYKPKTQIDPEATNKILINSFNQLIDVCETTREKKLKYELEKNVNLVKFEKNRIEISFNDNLDKSFVKDLSSKLLHWTGERWIISFSKNQGELSIKEKKKRDKEKIIEDIQKSELYKKVKGYFSDAELTDVNSNNGDLEND